MTEAIEKLMEEEINKTTNHMISKQKFKNIEHFKFLSVVIWEENQTSRRVNETVNDNRVYYSTYKRLGSNLLIRNTKMKLYNTVIRPVLTYGAETWRRTPAMSFRGKNVFIGTQKILWHNSVGREVQIDCSSKVLWEMWQVFWKRRVHNCSRIHIFALPAGVPTQQNVACPDINDSSVMLFLSLFAPYVLRSSSTDIICSGI